MTAIVAKFGGTSVKDVSAIRQSVSIVLSQPLVRLVVVSATATTTNSLEEFASKSLNQGDEALNLWERIHKRHIDYAHEISGTQEDLDETLEILHDIFCEGESLALRANEHGSLTSEFMDSIYSLGERMSSPLFTLELRNQLKKSPNKDKVKAINFDAREVMWTDENFLNANPLKESIHESAKRHIPFHRPGPIYVTQGFIGSTIDGRTTTFGREGSDFTAALFAEALRAKELQIWTDVQGVASCDPRVVKNVRWIKELDFDEASALAQGGAKVLFPKTLIPVRELGIPVFVGSSLKGLDGGGTWIMNLTSELPPRFVGISFDREGLSLVGLQIDQLKEKILDKLNDLSFDIRSVETEQNSIRLVIAFEDEERDALNEIHQAFKLDESEYT